MNCSSAQNFFVAYGTAYFEEFVLPAVVADFADDADLDIYNNWEGRCSVTHKPIYPGDNGWLYGAMRFHPIEPY